MNEATLNGASTQTSTGSGWFSSLFNSAKDIYSTYQGSRDASKLAGAANNQAAATLAATTSTNNTAKFLTIGGIALVAIVIVVVLFRK